MELAQICTSCLIKKNLSEFCKTKREHNNSSSYYCKECTKAKNRKYFKTKIGLVSIIYTEQKRNSKKRCHDKPSYTKIQLQEWLVYDWLFDLLFTNWVNCGYLSAMKPSIDRIDNNKGYSFANIQVMTWSENKQRSHDDIRNGKLKHGNKPQKTVFQFTLDGILIKEFVSINEASRQTNVNYGNICSNCKGNLKTAGGFIWQYSKLHKT